MLYRLGRLLFMVMFLGVRTSAEMGRGRVFSRRALDVDERPMPRGRSAECVFGTSQGERNLNPDISYTRVHIPLPFTNKSPYFAL